MRTTRHLRGKGPEAAAIGVALLAAAAGLALASAEARVPARAAASRDFQRLVGGLGLGPAIDLARCDAGFDPRLGDGCPLRCEPLPLGDAWCPRHAPAARAR